MRGELGAHGHEAGHLVLGEGDLGSAEVGEGEVGNFEVKVAEVMVLLGVRSFQAPTSVAVAWRQCTSDARRETPRRRRRA